MITLPIASVGRLLATCVQKPAAVRYAWADSPDGNLTNGTGLPASPFRTDDFPGITANAR